MIIDHTTPFKLASKGAEKTKNLITSSHGTTKKIPFEAHMGQKSNTPLSNIAATNFQII